MTRILLFVLVGLVCATATRAAFIAVDCDAQCHTVAKREAAWSRCATRCYECNVAGKRGWLASEQGSHPNQFARCADPCKGDPKCIDECHKAQSRCGPLGSRQQQKFCPLSVDVCLLDCTKTEPGHDGNCIQYSYSAKVHTPRHVMRHARHSPPRQPS
ncbi:hypothetical protein CF336_g4783 [Tilletia laevis]|nr:hypothetical protein CF336_g4783 [Tilletia laevis]